MTRDDRLDAGGLLWRKSTYSNAGNQCVEVAQTPTALLLRDSKNPEGLCIPCSRTAWSAMLTAIKGEGMPGR